MGRLGVPEAERLDAGFEQVMALVDRMSVQIEELVDVARLRAGQPLQLRPETVDFVAFLRQTTLMHEETSPRHGIRFETTLDSLAGQCGSVRMARVLDNLISNAVTYSPDGGTVAVTLRQEHVDSDEHTVIEVRDEGIGIPAADLPHIFERFRRGGNVTEHTNGNGLGLAGARQTVEQHGGQTSIDSREGQGTTVTVRLPLTPVSPIT